MSAKSSGIHGNVVRRCVISRAAEATATAFRHVLLRLAQQTRIDVVTVVAKEHVFQLMLTQSQTRAQTLYTFKVKPVVVASPVVIIIVITDVAMLA